MHDNSGQALFSWVASVSDPHTCKGLVPRLVHGWREETGNEASDICTNAPMNVSKNTASENTVCPSR